jgi:selenocysteine-specific elongation factor
MVKGISLMKYVIVGTAGHIDHGKTALVKALTGIDADRLKEEKERGITIDIGFADLALEDLRIGFVDVPGHERFIKNMLAGAHGLDLVMLVVAADESVMPQTREHFDICRLLNVKSGLVALTKADLVDAELMELARAEVEDFIQGSFLEGAPMIAVSSRTGQGIEELKSSLAALAAQVPPKAVDAVPRLPIDRVFSIKGFGTVVTGTLIAGEIAVGDELEILPAGVRARVRNLQVHGHDADRAFAGQRTAVNLQGVNVDQVERGAVLAAAGRLPPASMLDARLRLLDSAPRVLSHRARVRLHHGTAEVMARVALVGDGRTQEQADSYDPAPDVSSGRGRSSHRDQRRAAGPGIRPGENRLVQLRLESPITALPGDHFIIRSYSPQVTIGGGIIVDALPQKHRIRSPEACAYLERLEQADLPGQVGLFIEMAGPLAMTGPEIAARTGATDPQISDAHRKLAGLGEVVEAGTSPLTLMSRSAHDRLAEQVLSVLSEHHRSQPLSLGLNREELRDKVFGNLKAEVFRTVVQGLAASGKVEIERDLLRLATQKPVLSTSDASAKQALENAIKKSGLQAGPLEEVAAGAGMTMDRARKLYNLLAAERRVARIGDFVFHLDSLEGLKERVRAHKSVSHKIDVAVFKEITGGLTRKYAIPLLEYLDRERVTRRIGNEREIL